MSFSKWLHRREYGLRPNFGDGDFIMNRIYTALQPQKSWNEMAPTANTESEYGAVFNLEFSPEGNILGAACEKKAIILFDSITQKQTHCIINAHSDNVNCIKFLNKCTFATCSDDTTVAIWDVRFLKKRLRSLQGHSNWVKNIEYSCKDGLLVTSGFDGSIFTWDINAHTEQGLIYQKVFNTSGLMRCRISPDCNKLVMCTTGGYLMIIHNLDLRTLHKDLCGFRPSVYRLMQLGNQYIPQAAKFNHIFSHNQKRNRVELVTDFPDGNDAEIILALQMHPHGLSFLSRNISYDEQSEWSCIHDINEELHDITVRKPDKRKRKLFDNDDYDLPSTSNLFRSRYLRRNRPRTDDDFDQPSTSAGIRATGARRTNTKNTNNNRNSEGASSSGASTSGAVGVTTRSRTRNSVYTEPARPSYNRTEFVPDIWAAEITVQERAARQARGYQTNSVTGYDFVYAISSGIIPQQQPVPEEPMREEHVLINLHHPNADGLPAAFKEKHILQNAKKLMYYIQELNTGKGFIKEPCFSSDGRIICSPHDTGVRLLSYSNNCSEHPVPNVNESLKNQPRRLVQIKTINCHSDVVLSTSFSPTQPLLVTGCKRGKVTWHYPNL